MEGKKNKMNGPGDSVQFKMVSMSSKKDIITRSTPSLRRSRSNVGLIDNGPLSSFQGRSSSASSFHASLLQAQ